MSLAERLREFFSLRTAIAEASRQGAGKQQRASTLLAWGRQQAAAAEALWGNGHSAEALRLARSGLKITLQAVAHAGDADTSPRPEKASESEASESEASESEASESEASESEASESEASESEASDPESSESDSESEPEGDWVAVLRNRSGAALVSVVQHALSFEALPMLDSEVSAAHAERFRDLMRARAGADATIRYVVRTVPELRATRRRRRVAAGVVMLLVLAAVGLFAQKRIELANAPWVGRYYPQRNFQGDPKTRNDPHLDFDWATGSPLTGIPSDNWSARWDTCVRIQETQQLGVSIGSDDGSRVTIDGESVIDNWRPQAERWSHGSVNLEPGIHHIRIEYFEATGKARLRARLRAPKDLELFRPVDPDARCGVTPEEPEEPEEQPAATQRRPPRPVVPQTGMDTPMEPVNEQ